MNSKIFQIIGCMIVLLTVTPRASADQVNHQPFDELLGAYVQDAGVDYGAMCQDPRLAQYLDILKGTNPDAIAVSQERFAFWLNVYNAYSIQAICAKYPIDNINDLHFGGMIFAVLRGKSVWDQPIVNVGGQTYTLKEVDHKILRPNFKDPRIQFAIACGAVGCAPSRNEAYVSARLDEQLDDQARRFIQNREVNSFNAQRKRAELSPLFKWSSKDFGGSEIDVLKFIAQYAETDIQQKIVQDPSQWKIKYKKYDLSLNDIR